MIKRKLFNERLKNMTNNMDKVIKDGFKALNENVVDCAKSLRRLADVLEPYEKKEETNDGWYAVTPDSLCVPGSELKYVVVRIRNIFTRRLSDIPQIAEFRDGKWFDARTNEPYGSDNLPFHVDYWKPI